MDLKYAAKRLLKLADQIDREASENSYFVCDHCNHTASLAEINDRRVKLASEEDPGIEVQRVTVNDRIKCAACDGAMEYVASEGSDRYYVAAEGEEVTPEADDLEEAKQSESPVEGDEEGPGDADVDIDKLFEDVETQAQKAKSENEDEGEDIPKEPIPDEDTSSALPPEEPRQEKSPTPAPSEGEESEEETPATEDEVEEGTPVADDEIEEEVLEEEPVKKPKKKKDKPDDGKANWNKEEVPKFKSKEAIERFASSIKRYSL